MKAARVQLKMFKVAKVKSVFKGRIFKWACVAEAPGSIPDVVVNVSLRFIRHFIPIAPVYSAVK